MVLYVISAANNSTPIQITTSTAHGLVAGQTVAILDCVSNRNANGIWTIANVTSNTFTLTGSVGTYTITNATNASPIVITVSNPHKFITGDTVLISGVGGNTNANGTRTITVINTTSFSLNGINGNATYTSGGTVNGVYAGFGYVSVDTFAISNASNATPIVITSVPAHRLVSGQIVTISGVGGNTNANGTFSVVVSSTTQFSLYSTSSNLTTGRTAIAGNGAYTSGGYIFPLVNYLDFNVNNGLTLVDGYFSNSSFGFSHLLNNIMSIDGYGYSGSSINFGGITLENNANVFDASKYSGSQTNYGELSLEDGYEFKDVDYDATSIYPKDKTIYYKLRGYNPNTQTHETWVTKKDIVKRPELYSPELNPPNYLHGIYYTPPSGNSLVDIVIISRWIE